MLKYYLKITRSTPKKIEVKVKTQLIYLSLIKMPVPKNNNRTIMNSDYCSDNM